MTTNILTKWWQGYRRSVCAIRTPKYCPLLGKSFREASQKNRSKKLHYELMVLLHGQSDTAERLIGIQKIKHPGQLESWYLDKVIYDLAREV